jgi:Carboxypeptidase regulatory-like domain/TonB dependent receptor
LKNRNLLTAAEEGALNSFITTDQDSDINAPLIHGPSTVPVKQQLPIGLKMREFAWQEKLADTRLTLRDNRYILTEAGTRASFSRVRFSRASFYRPRFSRAGFSRARLSRALAAKTTDSWPFGHLKGNMKNRLLVILWAFALIGALLVAIPAAAQLTTADILGTVTDSAGAVVPGAKVTVVNTETSVSRTLQTNGSGEYVFNLLPPGQYTVTVEAPSFKKSVSSVTLVAGDRARLDAPLQIGETNQVVEVTATSPALQTDSATLRDTVSSKSVQDLPLNGRNYITLVATAPGAAAGPSNSILSGTRPDDRRQTSAVVANGQTETFNNHMVDGMDNNERQQFSILYRPSIDSLEEVKIDTNAFPAEEGRAGGAVINLITKSGTNAFHGGVYEYFRNDKLNANDFFANSAGIGRAEFHQNQFGGSVAGRIKKDKTFFFGDIEILRQIQGKNTGLLAAPTAFELANPGNFSDVGGPIVPASKLDPVAVKYLALLPAANIPGAPPTANYSGNVSNQYFSKTVDARIDHRFSDRDSIFGRFTYNPTTTVYPTLYPQVKVGSLTVNPGNGIYPGNSTEDSQAYMLDFVHIFSPTLVMELKGGFTRLNIATLSANQGTNLSNLFGIPGSDVGPYVSGLMNTTINGYQGTGSCNSLGDCTSVPIYEIDNVFQEEGTLTWTHGTHNVKFGAGLIRRQEQYYQNPNGQGNFVWSAATAGGPPNSLANFLQGVPTTITRQYSYQFLYFRTWEPHIFIQDDWHATRKLTFNLGLRWDHIGQVQSATGQRSNYQIASNTFCISANACVQPNWKQFQPRFGYAYNAGKGFVFRGGFGMSEFAQDYASGSLSLPNPPFVTVNFTCSPAALTGSSVCPAGVGKLSQGPPPIVPPNIPQLLGPVAGGLNSSLTVHDDYYPAAKVIEWNFTMQKQLGANVFTVAYVGSLGRHLQYLTNVNLPAPSGSAVTPAYLRAATLPNITGISDNGTGAASEYNAAQFIFERRYAKGLTVNANYVFARNLTTVTDLGSADPIGLLTFNRSYDWGNSSIGFKHKVTGRANYELPFGKGATGFKKTAIGGWQLNVIAFWQSGEPYTVTDGQNLINLPNITADRPNQVPGQSCQASNPSIHGWVNYNAFQQQPIGFAGSEGRGQCYGPNWKSLDFSIFKDFVIAEHFRLSFRAEAYNITNTPNFALPVSAISGWTVKRDPTGIPTNAGTFGQITSTNIGFTPRVMQLALRLSF